MATAWATTVSRYEWKWLTGLSPKVHNHLNSFKCTELQLVMTAPKTSLVTFCLYAYLLPFCMRPISVVSSANFRNFTDMALEVQFLVYRE